MKKTVYIPIEVKVREFISQIFLASKLINLGYRVYLGTREQIFNLLEIKKNKGGIFFYKGGVPLKYVDVVNNKTDVHVVFDQELLPGHTGYKYYERIIDCFSIKGEKYVDFYLAVNRQIYNVAKKVLNKIRGKVFLTGSPRIDLWKKKYHYLHNDEKNKIYNKYGDFYLFNSDFGWITEDSIERFKWAWDNVLKKEEWSGNFKKNNYVTESIKLIPIFYKEFLDTVIFLKELAKKKKIKIIIRPHPSEDKYAWKHHFRKIKNVYVEDPINDVTPWILACKGLLHRGCSTSLQSLIIGKPTYFIDLGSEYKKNYEIKKYSYNFSLKIFQKSGNIIFQKKISSKIFKKKKYFLNYLGIDKKVDSVDKIIKIFENCKINNENKITIIKNKNIIKEIKNKFLQQIKFFLYQISKILILKKKIEYNSFDKMPNRITVKEVFIYLKKFNTKSIFSVKKIINDLIVVEKKN